MSVEKLRPVHRFTEEHLAELRAIAPEVFADGAIDRERLLEAFGAYLEEDGAEAEPFGLNWPGKRQARQLASQPSTGTLAPAPGEGLREDTTRNLFIAGDNLEVLKLLQKSYAGRVKMIYIDPPYNTGNEFVYRDDYREPLEDYLRRTGQKGVDGRVLTTNTRTQGRFHSNWLSMIYPRLVLARSLLRDDGIIFISIDDNEQAHLKLLLHEIFGEENFLASVIWEKVYSPRMDTEGFSVSHDYVLVYGKSDAAIPNRFVFAQNERQFNFIDERTGRQYRRRSLRKEGKDSLRSDVPSMYFALTAPDGTAIYPVKPDGTEGRWRWSPQKYETERELGNVEWVLVNGTWQVYAKQYLDTNAAKPPVTVWSHAEVGHNHEANMEIAALLGPRVFDTPKPTRLIKKALQVATTAHEPAIVMDFFAGSGTTAQAVLELNREDGGQRSFVCVQFPEPLDNAAYPTIAEIGKERIRRVIARMEHAAATTLDLQDRTAPEDLGFKVYTLSRSNYKAWQNYTGNSIDELEMLFDQIETPLVEDWQPAHLLTEILLLQGCPLDSTVTLDAAFPHNRVYRAATNAFTHRLWVCLDAKLAEATIAQLHLDSADVCVCLDSALTDEAKLRLADRCTLKVI